MPESDADNRPVELPDHYETVAEDVLAFCDGSGSRIWVDLGSGAGGVGLALLEKLPDSLIVLIDPDAGALRRGLDAGRERSLGGRVVAVVGSAECLPLPDESVDVVVSRGSLYFWQDRAQGLREVWRVLRPGGWATRCRLGVTARTGGHWPAASTFPASRDRRAHRGYPPGVD